MISNKMSALVAFRAIGKRVFLFPQRPVRHSSIAVTGKETNPVIDIEDIPEYPPIKPKYPPGTWGDMKPEYAWQWQELKEKLMSAATVQERQLELLNRNTLAMFKMPRREFRIHNFDERINELIDYATVTLTLEHISDHPSSLQFRKYVTKTHLMPWEQAKPKIFDSFDSKLVDDAVKNLKKHIYEHILMESAVVDRASSSPEAEKTRLSKSLIRCISEALILELGKHCSHLQTCQYDEDVTVRALWSRHGLERKKRMFKYDPDEEVYETVQDHPIISENVFDAMVRYHLPLPEFEPDLGRAVPDLEPPKLMFKPSVYGQGKASNKLLKSILAGHKMGDPCEYGLIGIISTCKTHDIEKSQSPKAARDCRLTTGLTSTFTWLAAQACNQGFSHVIDLTYPLTSQAVMTDGEKFSFLAYQLNTLELWKDDAGNNKVNLCWFTDEMPLYHSIESGKVREFNDDVLKLLVKMFMLAPAERAYDLKPTISDKPDSYHVKCDFVPNKPIVEKVIAEEQYIVT